MKLPTFLRRAGKERPRPLSAQLDNPYRPVYGRERRFEELTGPKAAPTRPETRPGGRGRG